MSNAGHAKYRATFKFYHGASEIEFQVTITAYSDYDALWAAGDFQNAYLESEEMECGGVTVEKEVPDFYSGEIDYVTVT